jgi:hypothetical protein
MANGEHGQGQTPPPAEENPLAPVGHESFWNRALGLFKRENVVVRLLAVMLLLLSAAVGALIPSAGDAVRIILSVGLLLGIVGLVLTVALLLWYRPEVLYSPELQKQHYRRDVIYDRVMGVLPMKKSDPISASTLMGLLHVDPGTDDFDFAQAALGDLMWHDRITMEIKSGVPHYRWR